MAEHKGLPVASYPPQSDEKVVLVDRFKEMEERLLREIDDLTVNRTFRASSDGSSSVTDSQPSIHADQRWLAVARTHVQEGFMALNRSVFQPGRISLPEDTD